MNHYDPKWYKHHEYLKEQQTIPEKTCPNPKCKKQMKCIVNDTIRAGSRIDRRWICACGASVREEWDLFEI